LSSPELCNAQTAGADYRTAKLFPEHLPNHFSQSRTVPDVSEGRSSLQGYLIRDLGVNDSGGQVSLRFEVFF
jgi:hypothetical protein